MKTETPPPASFKELLGKVTPGAWKHAGGEITTADGELVGNTCGRRKSIEEMHYTGKYIARLNPATMGLVLAKLEEIETRLSQHEGIDITGIESACLEACRTALSALNHPAK